MAKRQKKKKQNITLDDLKQEAQSKKTKIENIVEKEKDKNVTLDDINQDLSKDEKLVENFDEQKINNEESVIVNNGNWWMENNEENISEDQVGDDTNTISTLDNVNTTPAVEDTNDTPVSEDTNTTPTEEDANTTSVAENTNTTSTEEDWNTTPVEENTNTTPAVEDANTTPVAEDTNTTPVAENTETGEQNNQVDVNNSSDDKITDENSKNSENWENDKWDIVLDNLWDHINNENMNVINVNDEKYNLNTTNDTTSWKALQESTTDEDGENIKNWEWGDDWVNLDEINIAGIDENGELQLDLSGGSLYDIQKAPRVKTWKITVFSVLISIICIMVWVLAYFYNDFITHDLTNIEENRAYSFVESAKDFVNKYKKWDETNQIQSINLIGKNWKTELDSLISSNLNYIQKKEILDDAVSKLSNNIIAKYARLNEIRNDITRYGFFPKDLSNIISESEPISSIQNSLIALEAIKFSSAISVFSHLDTFTTSLVQSLGIDRAEVEEKVWKVTSRWESDINIYIKNCYLNPFEWDYDCEYIWDFNEYYKNLNDDFDTEFFKELIKYTDSRLEQSEIPNFTISFKEFNQADNEITFDIEINTLKEDEAELTKKWILSPHIFILDSLINSLRQSRFIVWDDISVKTLNVMPNTYIIWMSEINVNRSVNTFTVHIKKENAVEIDDFVYMDY